MLDKGINMDQLLSLAKADPSHTQLYLGLHKIDTLVKDMVGNVIDEYNLDQKEYYVKTEMTGQCYMLQLFSGRTGCCAGTLWPMADFLVLCENKMVEKELTDKTKQMLTKIRTSKKKYKSDKDIIWV